MLTQTRVNCSRAVACAGATLLSEASKVQMMSEGRLQMFRLTILSMRIGHPRDC
jgi:hypothetical protein